MDRRSKQSDNIHSLFSDWISEMKERWIIAASSFLGLYAIWQILKRSDTTLRTFTDRAIGLAILNGIDPSLRSVIYIKMIVFFILIFFAGSLLLAFTNRALKRNRIFYQRVAGKVFITFVILSFAIIMDASYYLSRQIIYGQLLGILYFLAGLGFLDMVLDWLFARNDRGTGIKITRLKAGLLGIIVLSLFAYNWIGKSPFFALPLVSLRMEIRSPVNDDIYEIQYDEGKGYRERNALAVDVRGKKEGFEKIKFRLSDKEIESLKLKPGKDQGEMVISEITLSTILNKFRWTAAEIIREFSAPSSKGNFIGNDNLLYAREPIVINLTANKKFALVQRIYNIILLLFAGLLWVFLIMGEGLIGMVRNKLKVLIYRCGLHDAAHWIVATGLLLSISITALVSSKFSARPSLFGIRILIFVLLAYCCIRLLSRLEMVLATYIKSRYIRVEQSALFLLSSFGIAVNVLFLLSKLHIYEEMAKILHFFILLTIAIITVKALAFHKKRFAVGKALLNYHIMALSLLSTPVSFFVIWVAFARPFILSSVYYLWYLLLFAVFWGGYHLLLRQSLKLNLNSHCEANKLLLISCIPFILIPLSIPISNELQFSLSSVVHVAPRLLSGIVILMLIAGCFMLFSVFARIKTSITASMIVKNIYFPILAATLYLFKYHTHSLNFKGDFDLLHLGQEVFATQQLISFNKIPFVDMWAGANGLNNMLYQLLYSFINGSRGLEMLLWQWVYGLVGIVLVYGVLSRLTSALFSLLVVALLPLDIAGLGGDLFVRYFVISFLPALCLYWTLKRPTFKRLCIFWGSVVFVGMWMPSLATGIILGSVIAFGGYYCIKGGPEWKKAIASFVCVMGISLLIYSALVIFKDKSIVEIAILVKNMATTNGLIGSYPLIIKDFSGLAVFQYFILPAISVIYVMIFMIRVVDRRVIPLSDYILVFLAVFTLVYSLRGLERHCLLEGFWPYLFVFLGLILPFFLRRFSRESSQVIFLVCFMIYLLFWPIFTNIIKEGRLFEFREWRDRESRITMADDFQFKKLVQFLRLNLRPGQTFFEFMNAPLLYFFTEREFPFYYHAAQIYFAEPPQVVYTRQMKTMYEANKIPFVIFKDLQWWGSAIDNIPTEISAFRISEFIYKHYRPLGYIGTTQIWVANNYNQREMIGREDVSHEAAEIRDPIQEEDSGNRKGDEDNDNSWSPRTDMGKHYTDLMKLPYVWGTYDVRQASSRTPVICRLNSSARTVAPGSPLVMQVDPNIDKSEGNYLHFSVKASTPASIIITYGKKDINKIRYRTVPTGVFENYLVRISSQAEWMGDSIDTITVEATSPLEFGEVAIRMGD